MRAIVQDRYGSADVLRIADVDKPTPRDDEVLVRVHAASVHADVWHTLVGRPFLLRLMGSGLRRPKRRVPGTDLAGVVESVGAAVTRFTPGDEVFGETIRGIQWRNGGAFAEHATAPEKKLAPKPADLGFVAAAAIPTSGLIALQAVRYQGQVQAGQRVLINGAGGGVGGFSVELAKAYGAEVTGVDAAGKLAMIRSLGADHVIDYAADDFTRAGQRYDVIVDIPGNRTFADIRRALTPKGVYVFIGHDDFGRGAGPILGSMRRIIRLAVYTLFVSQRMSPGITKDDVAPMQVLAGFVEDGKLVASVDRTYPLEQVPDAIRYLEQGDVHGKIVISIDDSAD